jgi:hypothetical protein
VSCLSLRVSRELKALGRILVVMGRVREGHRRWFDLHQTGCTLCQTPWRNYAADYFEQHCASLVCSLTVKTCRRCARVVRHVTDVHLALLRTVGPSCRVV